MKNIKKFNEHYYGQTNKIGLYGRIIGSTKDEDEISKLLIDGIKSGKLNVDHIVVKDGGSSGILFEIYNDTDVKLFFTYSLLNVKGGTILDDMKIKKDFIFNKIAKKYLIMLDDEYDTVYVISHKMGKMLQELCEKETKIKLKNDLTIFVDADKEYGELNNEVSLSDTLTRVKNSLSDLTHDERGLELVKNIVNSRYNRDTKILNIKDILKKYPELRKNKEYIDIINKNFYN